MTTGIALLILSMAMCVWLCLGGVREHRHAMALRRRLLDEAEGLLAGARITTGPDGFPTASGCIPDGRLVKIELVPDSMIPRRLPQLWLRLTLYEPAPRHRPVIGALARPTGAEYYSLVHDMPEWMTPPDAMASVLVRGDGSAAPWQTERVLLHFSTLFADSLVKEAVISPNGVRIIRQAAQGERPAHLFLRQSRFPIASVPAEDMGTAIAIARALAAVLPETEPARTTEAA
ncbi:MULTISPECIES: hypothetical protein [unclassified Sinorhizobium]|uniref:hypothetical protein n=1 Tax=unclassified Sinorhizobium TaxID=2613772 RepID=UPI003526B95D